MKKTHYRKLAKHDSPYLASWDLYDDEGNKNNIIRTIERVGTEDVFNPGDSQKEECTIIYWKEKGTKPMVVNVTNWKRLEKMYKTPFVEEMVGKLVEITTEQLRDGNEGLRFVPKIPTKKKPVLSSKDKRWPKAVEKLEAGEATVEAILKSYDVSGKDLEILMKAEGEKA